MGIGNFGIGLGAAAQSFQATNKARLEDENVKKKLAQSEQKLVQDAEKTRQAQIKGRKDQMTATLTQGVAQVDKSILALQGKPFYTPEEFGAAKKGRAALAAQLQLVGADAAKLGVSPAILSSALSRLDATIEGLPTLAQFLQQSTEAEAQKQQSEREAALGDVEFINSAPESLREALTQKLIGGRGPLVQVGDGRPGGLTASMAKRYDKAIDNRTESLFLGSSVATMQQLLDMGTPTGRDEQFTLKFRQLGQKLGIVDAEKLGRQELFQALSNRVILPQVKQLGRNPTDVDLKFIIDSNANLGISEFGNRLILGLLDISAKRTDLIATEMTKFLSENDARLGDPRLALQWDARLNSIMKEHELFTTAADELVQQHADASAMAINTNGETVVPSNAIPFDGKNATHGLTYSFRNNDGSIGVGIYNSETREFETGEQ